jgi:NUMOD4 motif.
MQEWREIVGFSGYSVSDEGKVLNDRTGRIMRTSMNTHGIEIVGLMQLGIQRKRSVAVLVGNAFIRTARSLQFDTPINLDGDRTNNRATNLAWRPLWFARKYHQQFLVGPQGFGRPVQNIQTGEIFETSWDAAILKGLLERELVMAILNRTYVFPLYQTFRLLE